MANFMKTYHSSLSIFLLLVSQKIITKYWLESSGKIVRSLLFRPSNGSAKIAHDGFCAKQQYCNTQYSAGPRPSHLHLKQAFQEQVGGIFLTGMHYISHSNTEKINAFALFLINTVRWGIMTTIASL